MNLRYLWSMVVCVLVVCYQPLAAQTIFEAVREGDVAAVRRFLIADSIAVHATDENQQTPLHHAAAGDNTEIVELLLDHGARLAASDRYGWTPLHYSAEHRTFVSAELLISRGAEVGATSVGGYTSLAVARMYAADSVASLLLLHGADPTPAFTDRIGPWFGEDIPDTVPSVFALDLVSSSHHEHGTVTFSPDGLEAYWESYGRILTSRMTARGWIRPEFAPFSADTGMGDDVPFLSPDGERLYFISQRPTRPGEEAGVERIWSVARTEAGWSEPSVIHGGPNALGGVHWQFSVARNGSVYFAKSVFGGYGSSDIYISRVMNGVYQTPQNLGAVINSEAFEFSPFIAPDESYIIFSRPPAPDARRDADLYIAFKTPEGTWTQPVNMGESVNSSASDICPQVSGNGRFLFWNSRVSGNYDNYWIDAEVIHQLRNQALHNE